MLRNAQGIRDAARLRVVEANFTGIRIALLRRRRLEGNYDLNHLQAFHRFLFEGFYDWAGEIRSVEIAKTDWFCPARNIHAYGAQLFAKLAGESHLRGLNRDDFVDRLAYHLGEVNALHPFREGNGRAQRAFFAQLAEDAGYSIEWERIDEDVNVRASIDSLKQADHGPLREMLDDLVVSI